MVRRKSQKKSVRKPKRSSKRKNSRTPKRVSKFRMGSPEKVNLTTLPPDILYSISRSLTPRDRSRLVSTSKSTRANKSIIYQAPMEDIEITTYTDLRKYINYLKFLVAENINFTKISINIDYPVNQADIFEKWFYDIIDVIGDNKFKKISINISYFHINNHHTITFDYDKYKNINIYSIYMLDIDTVKNINFLKALDGMNVDRILYQNINDDTNICKYLCKVKTVTIYNRGGDLDFSFFRKRGSKTENICIYNFNLDTHEYFSGMNCVFIDTIAPILNVNNIYNVKYLITKAGGEVNIKNSYNIKNLVMCFLNNQFPTFELEPINMATNLHITTPKNAFENRMVAYLKKNGINVIEETDPCNNPILKIFDVGFVN